MTPKPNDKPKDDRDKPPAGLPTDKGCRAKMTNYASMTDEQLRLEVAKRKGASWWSIHPIEEMRDDGYLCTFGMECMLPDDKGDVPVLGWMEEFAQFTGCPNYPENIFAAKALTDEWLASPTPNGGHHEVHITYEDMDGTTNLQWWCALAQYGHKVRDYRWYTSEGQTTEERARVIAWLTWKDAENDTKG